MVLFVAPEATASTIDEGKNPLEMDSVVQIDVLVLDGKMHFLVSVRHALSLIQFTTEGNVLLPSLVPQCHHQSTKVTFGIEVLFPVTLNVFPVENTEEKLDMTFEGAGLKDFTS